MWYPSISLTKMTIYKIRISKQWGITKNDISWDFVFSIEICGLTTHSLWLLKSMYLHSGLLKTVGSYQFTETSSFFDLTIHQLSIQFFQHKNRRRLFTLGKTNLLVIYRENYRAAKNIWTGLNLFYPVSQKSSFFGILCFFLKLRNLEEIVNSNYSVGAFLIPSHLYSQNLWENKYLVSFFS